MATRKIITDNVVFCRELRTLLPHQYKECLRALIAHLHYSADTLSKGYNATQLQFTFEFDDKKYTVIFIHEIPITPVSSIKLMRFKKS